MLPKTLSQSTFPLILGIVPWLYAVLAEFMTPATSLIAAPLAYVCLGASITMCAIALRQKTERNVWLAWIILLFDVLYVFLIAVYFLVYPH